MPRSGPNCASDAVSEVLGAILTFGITSVIVLVAMLGFDAVQDEAGQRAVGVEALAIADAVAGDMESFGRFLEQHGESVDQYERHLGLPDGFEGSSYTIDLAFPTSESGDPCRDLPGPIVYVRVHGLLDACANVDVPQVITAAAGPRYVWCEGPGAGGGSLRIVYVGDEPVQDGGDPPLRSTIQADCDAVRANPAYTHLDLEDALLILDLQPVT